MQRYALNRLASELYLLLSAAGSLLRVSFLITSPSSFPNKICKNLLRFPIKPLDSSNRGLLDFCARYPIRFFKFNCKHMMLLSNKIQKNT